MIQLFDYDFKMNSNRFDKINEMVCLEDFNYSIN